MSAWSVFMLISVKNLGAPSIAEGFRLSIKYRDIKTETRPTFIPDGYTLTGEDGKTLAKFTRNEAIYEKTITPIPKGALVRGWLRYHVTNIPDSVRHLSGLIYTVHFTDITDKEYATTYTSTGIKSEPTYLPGSEQPFFK